jgi:hypothetical protein
MRVGLFIPKSLYMHFKVEAVKQGTTLSALVAKILESAR